MAECVLHAIAAILTTTGLIAINSGYMNIGYPMFAVGIFWLSHKEGE